MAKKKAKETSEETTEASVEIETASTAEETPATEETPVTEESSAIEETPATEEVPEAEEAGTAAESSPELDIGSEAVEEESEEPKPEPVIRGKIDKFGVAMGTGRRKTSVARVRIIKGDGKLTINGRPLEEYFKTDRDRKNILAPLRATESEGEVNVWVRVNGGGTTGQAGAVVLGISRALEAMNPSLHYKLAEGGYLTRDGRMVERKKYGFRKARRSFQFSKR
jgi:small subunit ribosomal protein S9